LATPGSPVLIAAAAERPGPLDPDVSPSQDLDASAQAQRGEEQPLVSVPLSPIDPSIPATIPAVLAETGDEAGLSEPELAGVATLADEFIAKVTAGSQNPRDPAHQQRWMEAQAESDAQVRARYGGHAWLRHHQQAYRQALANSLTP
jgi:hypothetical protein